MIKRMTIVPSSDGRGTARSESSHVFEFLYSIFTGITRSLDIKIKVNLLSGGSRLAKLLTK